MTDQLLSSIKRFSGFINLYLLIGAALGIKLIQIKDKNKNPIDQATHSAFSK